MSAPRPPLALGALVLLVIWAVAAGASTPPLRASAGELKRQIAGILASHPDLASARVGLYVKVLGSGRVLYSRQGLTPMVPASNLKVLTTAAALERLGPRFRYHTDLLGPAPDAQGVVRGDLYLRGSGDPTLTPPYSQPAIEPFRFMVRQLRAQGVRRIQGDVVADDSVFDREFLGEGWLERYRLDSYSAPVAGLSLNGNVVEVLLTADGIRTEPPTSGIPFENRLRSGSCSEVLVDRPRGSDTIVVQGTVAPGDVVRRALTVGNPPRFAAGAFQQVLREAGLPQEGGLRLIEPLGEPARVSRLKTYARYESAPLPDLLSQINHESDNFFAEHVFKTLGSRAGGRGTASTGEAAVKDFLRRNHVQVEGLRMVDGCGLSRLNRVSPAQMVGALEAMDRHPDHACYRETLPTGGQGTLTYRLQGLPVRAKTGTLARDSSLSGYVVSARGQTLAFSLLFNDVDEIWSAIDTQDRIVRLLAAWPEPL